MDSDHGKLFIGGISWETTEEKLKDYFKAYGEVVDAVIMKDRATGRARGFGFVVFADPLIADRVVQEKHSIDGRMVEAKKAVPRDEQQNVPRSNNGSPVPMSQGKTKKIFVGGLASTVTENDFRKYFGQFGTITDVVVMYDHNTQRPRGFGFITYDSEDAVDRVLQKSFHELNDKMVEVKRAIPKELSAGPTRNNGGGLGSARGSPYGMGYGQNLNASPVGTYGARMDSRYITSPANRGGYAPYGATGYGSSGSYSAAMAMNGVYGASAYGGSGSFGGVGYRGAPSGLGSYGGSGGGFGSSTAGTGYVSTPGRNVWGSGGVSYSSGGSSAGYGGSGGSGMSGYGGVGMWGPAQTHGSSGGYGSSSYVYGSSESAYSSSTAKYAGQSSGYGGSVVGYGSGGSGSRNGAYSGGYGDTYVSSGYGDSTWGSAAADAFNSAKVGSRGIGTGAFGLGDNDSGDVPPTGSGGYGGEYVSRRQSYGGVPA